jgi:hypothetical protein
MRSVHVVSTRHAKHCGKSKKRGTDHLMKDQSVGIRRVFELTKFPWPERIWKLVPAEGLEPTTP